VPPLSAIQIALCVFAADYYAATLGETLLGAIPPALKRSRPVIEPIPQVFYLTAAGAAATPAKNAHKQASLLAVLGEGPRCAADLAVAVPGYAPALKTMLAQAWVATRDAGGEAPVAPTLPKLTHEQARAVAGIEVGQQFAVHLLQGITGSGKTEVYLRLIAHALSVGGQALLLVPEINLTPQLAQIVAARFGASAVAIAHSSLADGERSRAWLDAQSGRARIVLGTRLSVFMPMASLKLIVVDEEHDPSYKQQEVPRYSARDLAIARGRLEGATVILGSATPSLETYENARRCRYQRHVLAERAIAAARPPTVRLVDTRLAKLTEGVAASVVEAIQARIARGEQSLVFINRRGYSPSLACFNCGWVSACPRCDAKSVFHRTPPALVCHQCGHSERVPRQCPACGNSDIKPVGRGTQRIESALVEMLPTARILRMDRDSMARKEAFARAREQVRAGEVDVLVGTQMLAKGHDYPRLTLVAVIDADRSLYATDFRAPERMFATLLQVAGRAGRSELAGEVLIQTDFPRHPVYHAVVTQDYDAFAEQELAIRERHGLPPFTYLILLRAESVNVDGALTFLGGIAQAARSYSAAEQLGAEVFDAIPALLARRAEVHRAQVLIAARSRLALKAILAAVDDALSSPPKGVVCWVDVDPQEV
jgi:primosomal protein N' (replication factor Y)